jgi:hypothetical protein
VVFLLVFVALPVTGICTLLAVGLQRAWAWAHVMAIIGAGAIADLLVTAVYSDVTQYARYPGQLDLGRLLTEAALILGGPGLVLALLLLPQSLRMLAARLAGAPHLSLERGKAR